MAQFEFINSCCFKFEEKKSRKVSPVFSGWRVEAPFTFCRDMNAVATSTHLSTSLTPRHSHIGNDKDKEDDYHKSALA